MPGGLCRRHFGSFVNKYAVNNPLLIESLGLGELNTMPTSARPYYTST